ncbi:MAG: tetratricopeptide repeat protein, partial [Rhodothermales bacterium]
MFDRLTGTPAVTLSARIAVALLIGVTAGCGERMPSPSSDAYAEVVTAFHTAIAAIEVGEDRRAEELLLRVVELAPDEAAAWANLGLLALRRNELDVAVDRLRHAQELAPNESRIRFLLGLVEATRGNAEEAITHFERARELDPRNVRAIYALAEQLETLRGDAAMEDVRRLVDAILEIHPNNLAVLVERARLDVIADDSAAFVRTMDRLHDFSTNWSAETLDQFASLERAREEGDRSETITELTFFTNVLKREPAYRESLAAVRTQPGQPTELISTFIALPSPPRRHAARDERLTFTSSPLLADLEAADASWRWVRATTRSASTGPVAVAGRDGEVVFEDGTVL